MGNVKTDCHSNMKLLIVLKIPSKFGWTSFARYSWKRTYQRTNQDKFEIKHCEFFKHILNSKGPVKLIQWVEKAPLFLHVMSKQFQFYTFKFVWVALHLSDKEFFKTIY